MAVEEHLSRKKKNLLVMIGPGILVAATGVGAGDLATAAFTGTKLGVAILWAVVVGAFFKFVLNEGSTRWQLATGSTLLDSNRLDAELRRHLDPRKGPGYHPKTLRIEYCEASKEVAEMIAEKAKAIVKKLGMESWSTIELEPTKTKWIE